MFCFIRHLRCLGAGVPGALSGMTAEVGTVNAMLMQNISHSYSLTPPPSTCPGLLFPVIFLVHLSQFCPVSLPCLPPVN
jgi:hypothetical protein